MAVWKWWDSPSKRARSPTLSTPRRRTVPSPSGLWKPHTSTEMTEQRRRRFYKSTFHRVWNSKKVLTIEKKRKIFSFLFIKVLFACSITEEVAEEDNAGILGHPAWAHGDAFDPLSVQLHSSERAVQPPSGKPKNSLSAFYILIIKRICSIL